MISSRNEIQFWIGIRLEYFAGYTSGGISGGDGISGGGGISGGDVNSGGDGISGIIAR